MEIQPRTIAILVIILCLFMLIISIALGNRDFYNLFNIHLSIFGILFFSVGLYSTAKKK